MHLPSGIENQERSVDRDGSLNRSVARAHSRSCYLSSAGTVSDDVNNRQPGLSKSVVADVQFERLGSQPDLECPRLHDGRI